MKTPQKNTLEQEVMARCRDRSLFRPGDRVLLAVSGGVDSVVMFHILSRIHVALGITLGVAHLNHGLRGKAADADAAWVRALARTHGYPFFAKKVNVAARARRLGWSLEETARNERYAFLNSTAVRHRYDRIVTAHHASDQAETVLARIIKGGGWKGLTGVREERELLVRPLLTIPKDAILRYARARRLAFREDATNADVRIFRNRIRRELLPRLRSRYDARVERHLNQLAFIAGETHRFLRGEAERLFSRVCNQETGKIVLEIKPFKRYLFAQKQALLELIFDKLTGGTQGLTFQQYQIMDRLITDKQSGKQWRMGHLQCLREGTTAVFRTAAMPDAGGFQLPAFIGRPLAWPTPEVTIRLDIVPAPVRLRRHPDREYLDRDRIRGELYLRTWKRGDAFYPLGMNHRKKLHDFFIDRKIPATLRRLLPILCEQTDGREHILWVCGGRIDERYKVTAQTRHLLVIYYDDPFQKRSRG